MTPELHLKLLIFVPLAGALLVFLFGKSPNLRELVTLVTGGTLFTLVVKLIKPFTNGELSAVTLAEPVPGLPIQLHLEPLGLMFALIASSLWIVTSIYTIGYMRGNKEAHQTRFYTCFAVSIAATMGIALAGNMFTLFTFYEVLTMSTFPLVTHKQNESAKKAGRVYLGILIGTSVGFLLFATSWTWFLTGTLDFTPGGILAGKVTGLPLLILLLLYMFGIGKAALMPFHRWLPNAMVAPTPVSALLHAVAVVKAGVFSVIKVTVYIFGIDLLHDTGVYTIIMWFAAGTILLSSIVALRQDNLKARLAYSTISQLSYIVLGGMLATTMGFIGGAMHIAMHAVGKITLFFCAGAIYTATKKTDISQMDGLGRKMPFTYMAFLIASLSIIGLPPLGGAWSKWYLILGSYQSGEIAMIAVLLISSLLNVAYLLPIVGRGFFLPSEDEKDRPAPEPGKEQGSFRWSQIKEAPIFCVAPLMLTAIGCFALFFFVEPLFDLISLVELR